MSLWYHGTNEIIAKVIMQDKFFKEGTWFARHLEDAIEFGGTTVFMVSIKFRTKQWQVCSANRIPTNKIIRIYTTTMELIKPLP